MIFYEFHVYAAVSLILVHVVFPMSYVLTLRAIVQPARNGNQVVSRVARCRYGCCALGCHEVFLSQNEVSIFHAGADGNIWCVSMVNRTNDCVQFACICFLGMVRTRRAVPIVCVMGLSCTKYIEVAGIKWIELVTCLCMPVTPRHCATSRSCRICSEWLHCSKTVALHRELVRFARFRTCMNSCYFF